MELASAKGYDDFYMIALILWSIPFLTGSLYWDTFITLWTICPLQLLALDSSEYFLSPDPHTWYLTTRYTTIIVISLASLMSVYLREKDRRQLFLLERLAAEMASQRGAIVMRVTRRAIDMSPCKRVTLSIHEELDMVKRIDEVGTTAAAEEGAGAAAPAQEAVFGRRGAPVSLMPATEVLFGPCMLVSIRKDWVVAMRHFARIAARHRLVYMGHPQGLMVYAKHLVNATGQFSSASGLPGVGALRESAAPLAAAAVDLMATGARVRIGLACGAFAGYFDPRAVTHASVVFHGDAVDDAAMMAFFDEARPALASSAFVAICKADPQRFTYGARLDVPGVRRSAFPLLPYVPGSHAAPAAAGAGAGLSDAAGAAAGGIMGGAQDRGQAGQLEDAAEVMEWLGAGVGMSVLTVDMRSTLLGGAARDAGPVNDLDVRGISQEARDAARTAAMVWRARCVARPAALVALQKDGDLSSMPVTLLLSFRDPELEASYRRFYTSKKMTSVIVMSLLFAVGWSAAVSTDLHVHGKISLVLQTVRFGGILPALILCMMALYLLRGRARSALLPPAVIACCTTIGLLTVLMLALAPAKDATSYGLYVMRGQMSIYSNYKIRYIHGLLSSLLIFGCYLAQFYALHEPTERSGHGSLWLILANSYLIVAGVVYSFFIEWTQRMLYWSTAIGVKEEDSTIGMKAFDKRLQRRASPLPLSRAEFAYVSMSSARPVVMDGSSAVVVLLQHNGRNLAATLNSSSQFGPRPAGSFGNLLAASAGEPAAGSATPGGKERRSVPRLAKQESDEFIFGGVAFNKAESMGTHAEDELAMLSSSGFARRAQLQRKPGAAAGSSAAGSSAGKYEALLGESSGEAASAAGTAAPSAATAKVDAVARALALIDKAVADFPSAQISSILGNAVVIMVRPGRSIASSSTVAASIACSLLSLVKAAPDHSLDDLHLAIGIASGDAICTVVPNGAAVGSRPAMALGECIDHAFAQAWSCSLEKAALNATHDPHFVMASIPSARLIRAERESQYIFTDSITAPTKSVRLTKKQSDL